MKNKSQALDSYTKYGFLHYVNSLEPPVHITREDFGDEIVRLEPMMIDGLFTATQVRRNPDGTANAFVNVMVTEKGNKFMKDFLLSKKWWKRALRTIGGIPFWSWFIPVVIAILALIVSWLAWRHPLSPDEASAPSIAQPPASAAPKAPAISVGNFPSNQADHGGIITTGSNTTVIRTQINNGQKPDDRTLKQKIRDILQKINPLIIDAIDKGRPGIVVEINNINASELEMLKNGDARGFNEYMDFISHQDTLMGSNIQAGQEVSDLNQIGGFDVYTLRFKDGLKK